MKNGTFVIERVVRGRWGALERERDIKYWADATKETLMDLEFHGGYRGRAWQWGQGIGRSNDP